MRVCMCVPVCVDQMSFESINWVCVTLGTKTFPLGTKPVLLFFYPGQPVFFASVTEYVPIYHQND